MKKTGKLKFEYLPLDKIDVSKLNVRTANLEEGIKGKFSQERN